MARTTTEHTIIAEQGPGHTIRLENEGTDAIMPGHLLEVHTDEKWIKHAEAGAPAFLIALETETPDTAQYPTTAKIDIPYANGERVYGAQIKTGQVYNVWLADGENVVKGRSILISDGAGRCKSAGTGNVAIGTTNPVFVAWEDNNNSGGGTAVRCLARAL